MARKYPKNWGRYRKLTEKFEGYVDKTIYPSLLKAFPTTKGLTIKSMTKFLVANGWVEEVQKYTYLSAVTNGYADSQRTFTAELTAFKTATGSTVNAWQGSLDRNVARRMVKRMKHGAKKISQHIAVINTATDPAKLEQYLKRIKVNDSAVTRETKGLKRLWSSLSEGRKAKGLTKVKRMASNVLQSTHYADIVKETTQRVNVAQGRLVSQDQFMQQGNKRIKAEYNENKTKLNESDKQLVQVGFWSLSPDHTEHYYADGVDPCKIHASHDAGYGEGSYIDDDIKIPVTDSHFGCGCSLELVVMEKK